MNIPFLASSQDEIKRFKSSATDFVKKYGFLYMVASVWLSEENPALRLSRKRMKFFFETMFHMIKSITLSLFSALMVSNYLKGIKKY